MTGPGNNNGPPEAGYDFRPGWSRTHGHSKDALTLWDVALDLAGFDTGQALAALRLAIELAADFDLQARAARILGPRRTVSHLSVV